MPLRHQQTDAETRAPEADPWIGEDEEWLAHEAEWAGELASARTFVRTLLVSLVVGLAVWALLAFAIYELVT